MHLWYSYAILRIRNVDSGNAQTQILPPMQSSWRANIVLGKVQCNVSHIKHFATRNMFEEKTSHSYTLDPTVGFEQAQSTTEKYRCGCSAAAAVAVAVVSAVGSIKYTRRLRLLAICVCDADVDVRLSLVRSSHSDSLCHSPSQWLADCDL